MNPSAEGNPSRLVINILSIMCPDSYREALLGDLQEEFQEIYRASGAQAAEGWLWRQALLSLPVLTGQAMRQHWRPGDIFGLMAGVAVAVLVCLPVCEISRNFNLPSESMQSPLWLVCLLALAFGVVSALSGGLVSSFISGRLRPAPMLLLVIFVLLPEFRIAWVEGVGVAMIPVLLATVFTILAAFLGGRAGLLLVAWVR